MSKHKLAKQLCFFSTTGTQNLEDSDSRIWGCVLFYKMSARIRRIQLLATLEVWNEMTKTLIGDSKSARKSGNHKEYCTRIRQENLGSKSNLQTHYTAWTLKMSYLAVLNFELTTKGLMQTWITIKQEQSSYTKMFITHFKKSDRISSLAILKKSKVTGNLLIRL